MKKRLWCRWRHNAWLCWPDVGGMGLKGYWHCSLCHPCWEGLPK